MFNYNADTAFILGAGFSKESNLPITRQFSDGLLHPVFDGELDRVITDAIKQFLSDCFLWKRQIHSLPWRTCSQ
jgi:hypothetical protein